MRVPKGNKPIPTCFLSDHLSLARMGVSRAVSLPFLDHTHRRARPLLHWYKHIIPKKTPKPRGGRLARRARSFKEDFFGKISQMRTPTGQRSSSPNKNHKVKNKSPSCTDEVDGKDLNQSDKDVDCVLHHVNQLTKCLQYFEEVVRKDKLEMLPGSATVVLETVLGIHSSLRKCVPTVNEQSSMLMSATNQVYQSLANLIRWSDEILLYNNAIQNKDSVKEVVNPVHDSVKNLVQLCMDRVQNKECKSLPSPAMQNGLCSPKPDRNSLPDIPLTPREREILQQTVFPIPDPPPHQNHLHHSTSSDSILSSANKKHGALPPPPPKPPFPLTIDALSPFPSSHLRSSLSVPPPPLPPKKRQGLLTFTSNTVQTNGTITTAAVNHNSTAEDLLSSLNWLAPLKYNSDASNLWTQPSMSNLDSNLNHSADDLLLYKSDNQTRHRQMAQLESRHCQQLMSHHATCSYAVFSSKKTTKTVVQSVSTGSSMDNILGHVTRASAEELSSDFVSTLDSDSPSPPPALPAKQRVTRNRTPSQYDNVPLSLLPESERHSELSSGRGSLEEEHFHLTHSQSMIHYPTCLSQAITTLCPHHGSHLGKSSPSEDGRPPPLPPKQKNVMAYMQIFGSYSQPAEGDFSRHSLHSYQVVQAQWQQVELSFMQQRSFTSSVVSSSEDSAFSESRSSHGSWDQSFGEDDSHNSLLITTPPALPPKKNRMSMPGKLPELTTSTNAQNDQPQNTEELPAITGTIATRDEDHWNKDGSNLTEQGPIDEIDVSHYLSFKKPEEDGTEDVRGGPIDALIVQATKAPKNDFYYQEAFLTTYRTFISPLDLIGKLLYRYNHFIHMSDMRQRAARNAFALLVRVVDDLCFGDIEEELLRVMMDFICQLVSSGDLVLARALRKKVIEKCESKQRLLMPQQILLPSMAISTHHASLLDFKSEHLAEQMTVLDAALFQKIEIPEVLLWAKEQKEEMSPNLTTFTEHFNKMSYWARSRILDQEDGKDRERYVMKFIKMMKHLRKLNNFNSYLAILSALDSAPIRRLEWQRNITEGLKEYCALIDSSSSFRAYRQALAETEPPCIPYIGLILQDLTFVHIGNPDALPSGDVNFSKRWQQFNILDNMKRFHNCHFPFKRDANIIEFFNNFDEYLCEEAMWQISESIKPRGGKKKPNQS